MHNVLGLGARKRFGRLRNHVGSGKGRQPPFSAYEAGQIFAGDELHDEVVQSFSFSDIKNRHNVGVACQGRSQFCFLLESADDMRVLAEMLGQHLNRK